MTEGGVQSLNENLKRQIKAFVITRGKLTMFFFKSGGHNSTAKLFF
jgi:hypothetical protein